MRYRMELAVATSLLSLVIAVFGVQGCSSSKSKFLLESPKSGYVPEIEEPGVRGQLVRVSPENLEVAGRMAISPDGEQLICSARPADAPEDTPLELYRIGINGGGAPIKLTSGSHASSFDPSFTSDGAWIVFASDGAFWKMRADGSGARTKIGGSGLGFDCCGQLSSTDRLAFTSVETTYNSIGRSYRTIPAQAIVTQTSLIWTVAGSGGELTQFREGLYPSWSPGGDRLAFTYADDIWMMDADGRNLTQVTNTADVAEGLPAFAPNGDALAYVSNAEGDKPSHNYNIWLVRLDTFQKQQLTQLDAWDSWPCWHPDGICFLSGRGSKQRNVASIWMYRLADDP